MTNNEIETIFIQNNQKIFIDNIESLSIETMKLIISNAIFESKRMFLDIFLKFPEVKVFFNFDELFNFHYAKKAEYIATLILNQKIDESCFDYQFISILDNKHTTEASIIFSNLDNTNLQRLRYHNSPMYSKYKEIQKLQNIKTTIKKF